MTYSNLKIKIVGSKFHKYKKIVSFEKFKRIKTQKYNYKLGAIDTRLNKNFRFCVFNLYFFGKKFLNGIIPNKKSWCFLYYFFLAHKIKTQILKLKSYINLKLIVEDEIKKEFIFEYIKRYSFTKI